jgi:hypothetical protein
MASHNKPDQRPERGSAARDKATSREPAWADGLRQLYDSVVDEPLPDAFKDLLAQLDDGDTASPGGKAR